MKTTMLELISKVLPMLPFDMVELIVKIWSFFYFKDILRRIDEIRYNQKSIDNLEFLRDELENLEKGYRREKRNAIKTIDMELAVAKKPFHRANGKGEMTDWEYRECMEFIYREKQEELDVKLLALKRQYEAPIDRLRSSISNSHIVLFNKFLAGEGKKFVAILRYYTITSERLLWRQSEEKRANMKSVVFYQRRKLVKLWYRIRDDIERFFEGAPDQ